MYWSVRILVCTLPMKSIERSHRPSLELFPHSNEQLDELSRRTALVAEPVPLSAAIALQQPFLRGSLDYLDLNLPVIRMFSQAM